MSVAEIKINQNDDHKELDVNDAFVKVPSIVRTVGEHKEIHYFRLIIEMLNEMKQMKAKITELENKTANTILTIPKLPDNMATNLLQNNSSIMFYENDTNNCKIAFKNANGNKFNIML
jgi:hypothetical protein